MKKDVHYGIDRINCAQSLMQTLDILSRPTMIDPQSTNMNLMSLIQPPMYYFQCFKNV